ncbi:MAG: peptide/nickel transport system ATP-binding protein [Granulosicoccus sp.]|jgi:peptide/nickel transport system ATP-binding protein
MEAVAPATPVLALQDVGITLPPDGDREWAIRDITLSLMPRQTLCIVGESGSGKSVLAQAVMGMLPTALALSEGTIELQGMPIPKQRADAFNVLRGQQMALIFQDAVASLNPIKRVGHQLEEILQVHGVPRSERRSKVFEMLSAVLLPEPESIFRSYPHQLSGGQAQRIVIAGALLLNPALLIADEPTTALDVTTQAEILQLIASLQECYGTAVLFITHDFGVVADIADTIVVMKDGAVVETGDAATVLSDPQHKYTQRLLAAAFLEGRVEPVKQGSTILEADSVCLNYQAGGMFNRQHIAAVKNVSLTLSAGQTVAIVGESGSGKSSLAKCLLRLEDVSSGTIYYNGEDITPLNGAKLRPFRAKVQVVLQDPFSALNPRIRILDAVAEGPIIHGVAPVDARKRASEMLKLVGLTVQAERRYPQEFSGGQRQRICIARALVMQPDILIADEAVSALDVSIQLQILDLFADLQKRFGFAMIFITHNLRVAAAISDDVIVMRQGEVVEQGPTLNVFANPVARYTQALLASAPGATRGAPA